ncbi:hypothetical protein F5144DRAFT_382622 [Chaetomium tenue]|uniref:Uncharacterized protein n=1 Tax=Chaetomium tenue TaxID=1854479 RepID=A0ACB7NUL9_9PEZI|nr:hypothetical protein F5144DRAFT_382622 [Chaetomium globosum]
MRPLKLCSYAPPPIRPLLAKRHIAKVATPQPPTYDTVEEIDDRVAINQFRRIVAATEKQIKPVLFRRQIVGDALVGSNEPIKLSIYLPAIQKWFKDDVQPRGDILSQYFKQYSTCNVPYEFIRSEGDNPSVVDDDVGAFKTWLERTYSLENPTTRDLLLRHGIAGLDNASSGFTRFDAPLALLDAAVQYNALEPPITPISRLYIAQASLSDLPEALQLDVPTPEVLTAPATAETPLTADIYSSSLWLGLEPTFTPWHRDPNDNLFCQLRGFKTVRLLPPAPGLRLFKSVMAALGKQGASPHIRAAEMMERAERQAWRDAVWGPHASQLLLEAVVGPGDVLVIPKGYWHSVKSTADEAGALNASVNWWYRWRSPSSSGTAPVWSNGGPARGTS